MLEWPDLLKEGTVLEIAATLFLPRILFLGTLPKIWANLNMRGAVGVLRNAEDETLDNR